MSENGNFSLFGQCFQEGDASGFNVELNLKLLMCRWICFKSPY